MPLAPAHTRKRLASCLGSSTAPELRGGGVATLSVRAGGRGGVSMRDSLSWSSSSSTESSSDDEQQSRAPRGVLAAACRYSPARISTGWAHMIPARVKRPAQEFAPLGAAGMLLAPLPRDCSSCLAEFGVLQWVQGTFGNFVDAPCACGGTASARPLRRC